MSDRRRNFRASQAAQLFACAGSDLLQRKARSAMPPASTEAATAGRWCHAQAATMLCQLHGAVFQGERFDWPQNFKPTGFHLWMVAFYVQAVLELAHVDMAIEVEGEFQHVLKVPTYRFRDEQTGEIVESDEIGLSGHIDTVAITADATEATGFDLKTGADPVTEAADNAQVLFYIVLLKLAYPSLRKVTFYVVQPSNDPDTHDRISEVSLEGDALDRAAAYLEGQLLLVCANPYELNSDGWKQCRYCDAALICPALRKDIEDMKLNLTEEAFAAIAAQPAIDELARVKLADKKLTPIFERAAEALKERLVAQGGSGVVVDGVPFVLEDRPGKRKVTDNAQATQRLSILPDDLFHQAYEFKPAAIEDALALHFKLPKTSKKGDSGKSKFKELLGDITEQPVNKILKVG